jgi:hypothetical protein
VEQAGPWDRPTVQPFQKPAGTPQSTDSYISSLPTRQWQREYRREWREIERQQKIARRVLSENKMVATGKKIVEMLNHPE